LIKIFEHPWTLGFQAKINSPKAPPQVA